MNVKHRSQHKLPKGITVKQYGRMSHEFLCKMQFLRAVDLHKNFQTAVLMEEAVPLTFGKDVRATATSSLKGWVCLRHAGHLGACIEHYAWDRLGLTALERFVRQWHAHQNSSPHIAELAEEAGTTVQILVLLEIVVVTPCALHDVQNGFRWGMHGMAKDKELLRDVYIGIESLRNSCDLLTTYVAEWVATKLSFRADPASRQWQLDQHSLWEALGLNPDIIESLVFILEFEFADSRVWVSPRCSDQPSLVNDLVGTLLTTWKFPPVE